MAEGLNKVMLLGNLGADPELKMTAGGQAILKLRLATTDSYLDRNNTRQERTEWHHITIWGKRGEALAKFLSKGERIFIEGAIRTSSYEKNGEKRYRTEIHATNVILAGRSRGMSDDAGASGGYERRTRSSDEAGGVGGGRAPAAPAPAADDFGDYPGSGGGSDGDDEIPF